MRAGKIVLIAAGAGWLLAFTSGAQVTNVPPTLIENFEQQTDTVIVKGFSTIGTIPLGAATLSVRSKESSDLGHGQKAYGIAVSFSGSGGQPGNFIPPMSAAIDYDELDSLISGLDSISKATYDVTSLAGFDVSYTTKSGLCLSAHSDRRQGGIKTFIQFAGHPKIPFDSIQLAQLRNFVAQAKSALDALK